MPDELANASIAPEALFGEEGSEEEQHTLEVARLKRASKAYPWRGGWSTVNFFQTIVSAVPHAHTPRVAKLAYASPGSIDLDLSVPIAETISRLVAIVASAPDDAIDQAYKVLHREAQSKRLLGRNVKDLTLRTNDSMFVQTAGRPDAEPYGSGRVPVPNGPSDRWQRVRNNEDHIFALSEN